MLIRVFVNRTACSRLCSSRLYSVEAKAGWGELADGRAGLGGMVCLWRMLALSNGSERIIGTVAMGVFTQCGGGSLPSPLLLLGGCFVVQLSQPRTLLRTNGRDTHLSRCVLFRPTMAKVDFIDIEVQRVITWLSMPAIRTPVCARDPTEVLLQCYENSRCSWVLVQSSRL